MKRATRETPEPKAKKATRETPELKVKRATREIPVPKVKRVTRATRERLDGSALQWTERTHCWPRPA